MNKYDFGYGLEVNSTNKWAFEKIRSSSTVLEIGASSGRLTKNLKEKRNCIVDIIEINAEAGEKAKEYARKAYIGSKDGNIEEENCFQLIEGEVYDYIVLLDVLEHLINPIKVMKKIQKHLSKTGSILVSVPNIAHNSVIINLLQNKFQYTKLGLLDDTHIHFFTNTSFREMVNNIGYHIAENSAIQKLVGDTEIQNEYCELPREVAAYLRGRSHADVYQLLFELQLEVLEEPELITKNLDYTLYKSQVFWEGNEETVEDYFVNPTKIRFSTSLIGKVTGNQIRIDPLDKNCIVKNLSITGRKQSGEIIEMQIEGGNGLEIGDGLTVFVTNDPQLFVRYMSDIEEMSFSCECVAFDSNVITYFESLINKYVETEWKLREEKSNNKIYRSEYEKLLDVYRKTEFIKINIEEQYRSLEKQYRFLEEEYKSLKHQDE